MVRSFIQVTALVFTFMASIFLVKSSLILSAKDIASLSGTYFGHNKHLVKSLSEQQSDTRIGSALLFLAFLLQMINLILPMRISDFAINRTGVIMAIIFSVMVLLFSLWLSKVFEKKTIKTVETILVKDK
jgi:NADH:ubiquinone oxidoreductase subunit 3 (subunit A)